MRDVFKAIAAGLLLSGAMAQAQDRQHPDLPPEPVIVAALDNHPLVMAASARVAAARAQAGMLAVGPHEVTVQSSYARRTIEGERTFNEFDATVTRPFRLPGKAGLDRKAGALGIEEARSRMEDVRHQTALQLAALWYDWLTAQELARNDALTVANLERALTAVRRRAELRDAAQLDVDQAASALAVALGQLAESQARTAAARVTLAAQFSDVPLPFEPPALAMPHKLPEDYEPLRDLVIARSHGIGTARSEADRQSVVAQRARADRIADPSFGVRLFSERGGAEKGAGLIASIPLGGRHRSRAADEAAAVANAAALELSAVEREVRAMADADLSNARSRLAVWEQVEHARASAEAVSTRTGRGYALGSIDLADLLYAERQANEARRSEIMARSEAARALLKLEIDAHVIWVPGDEAK